MLQARNLTEKFKSRKGQEFGQSFSTLFKGVLRGGFNDNNYLLIERKIHVAMI